MLTFSKLTSGIYLCLCIIIRCYPCVLEKLKMGESNSVQGRSKLDIWCGGPDIHIFMFTHYKNNRFQKKLSAEHEYMNTAPPPQLSSLLRPWC